MPVSYTHLDVYKRQVVVNIDLTDSGGAGLPASQYLALGSGFVVKYSVGVGLSLIHI